ncbi:unnamed protein product [Rotaria sp. Silwood1]|nr:unnamed protein product [Rotaria sp. Silwood1]CAF1390267.1 unnamed protein product [Rotaria sp. Silwood1]CAF3553094.1 unnamed protein product [Rotaria sp. Silwood1]CAF3678302.1 unnamed protein product [Rotaria sp. Silwood1]CAF4713591.1 unnamed protein product [Rotaria sp. Silwood1]
MNITDGVYLTQKKVVSTSSETSPKSLNTPHINSNLLDDLGKDNWDNNDDVRLETNSIKTLTETEEMLNVRDRRIESNSSDNLSDRSSTEKSSLNTARDILARRHALDSIEKHDLRVYVRQRRNSIVQHVIGYNYDDNSLVGGLYTRVGIGKFVEGTVHALFILLALRKRLKRTPKPEYPAREMITLLVILDLSLWFEKTTTTTKHEANPFQLAFYHVIPWSIIAAIATPLQIFFRFHASVCLSHVWANMYHLPSYQPIPSRSF